jgi:hypothetical protein
MAHNLAGLGLCWMLSGCSMLMMNQAPKAVGWDDITPEQAAIYDCNDNIAWPLLDLSAAVLAGLGAAYFFADDELLRAITPTTYSAGALGSGIIGFGRRSDCLDWEAHRDGLGIIER